MPDGTVICRRCGVSNTSGDQFCGSCGAFLEWEGDPTEAPPVESAPPVVPPPLQPDPSTSEATVVCPACGHANPPTRTFCQRCGEVLESRPLAAPVAPAAAVARSSPPRASGGLPSWLPIVAGIGLLAGVGFVLASIVMRPAPVPPGATTVPSVTFTPTLPPSAAVPSTSGVASAQPPDESVPLTPTGATASSVVGNKEKFDAAKVIDGSLKTCWQEGSAEEKGEWIEVTFDSSRLDYVVIYSGYQLSNDAYRANRRPENILVSVNGGEPVAFVLADSEQPQRLDVDDTPGATKVRIEIVTTFDPEATAYPGSPFDDLAISEIRAFGQAGG